MNQIVRQTIFDKVVAFAATSPGKSINLEGDCVYRALSGRKCFLGALIDDEHYSPNMEDVTPVNEENGHLILEAIAASMGLEVTALEPDFLGSLQRVHDMNSKTSWNLRLKEFAITWKLTFPPQT